MLTADLARRWRTPLVTAWGPGVLAIGWLCAFVLALAGDDAVCSASDPSVCGPDRSGAAAFALCVATPVLLLWVPLAGCAVAVAFATLEVHVDTDQAARTAFGVHGAFCAAFALLMAVSGPAQEHVAGLGTGTALVPHLPVRRHPDERQLLVRLAVPVLLVVAAVVALVVERDLGARERVHVARSTVSTATVTGTSDSRSSTVTVRVTGETATRTLGVFETGPYPVGSEVPVRLDPLDPSWSRLVAEPQDVTTWLFGAVLCLVMAAAALCVQLRARAAARRLYAAPAPSCRSAA